MLSSDKIKLQGLVDIGSCALKNVFAQWAQQDMGPVHEAVGKFQALVEQSEKNAEQWKDLEGKFKVTCEKLNEAAEKIYKNAKPSVGENKTLQPPKHQGINKMLVCMSNN